MQYEIKNRFTGAVQFTAEIDCATDASVAIKIGLAVRWALKSGADLSRAYLSGLERMAEVRGWVIAKSEAA